MDLRLAKLVASNKVIALAWNWASSKAPILEPVLFQKPVSAIVQSGSEVRLVKGENLVHEIELAFYISKKASCVSRNDAYEFIDGYCLALDMTSPSILAKAKENKLSWDIGKGHDTFLPLSNFISKDHLPDPHKAVLGLTVNGELRQTGQLVNLNHKIPFILEYISSKFTLQPGDLILTGTPPNAAEVKTGDKLHGTLNYEGKTLLEISASIV